jgi:hypothetical protein
MPFQEPFRTFAREDLAIDGIAVRQRQHEHRQLLTLASQIHVAVAEFDLGFAGIMLQRQEDFLAAELQFPHRVLVQRVTAVVTVLGLQPLEDPPGRMPLLAVRRPVGLQDRHDYRPKRVQLGRPWRAGFPAVWWHRLRQDLLQRLPKTPIELFRRGAAELQSLELPICQQIMSLMT